MVVGGWRQSSAALPLGMDPVPIVQEAGCAPEPVWSCNIIHAIPSVQVIFYKTYSKIADLTKNVDRIAQSVQRLATGWTVRGPNPGGGEIFRTCPDRSWGPPSLLYKGYQVFLGDKERPGRDADPSPPSSAVVKKE